LAVSYDDRAGGLSLSIGDSRARADVLSHAFIGRMRGYLPEQTLAAAKRGGGRLLRRLDGLSEQLRRAIRVEEIRFADEAPVYRTAGCDSRRPFGHGVPGRAVAQDVGAAVTHERSDAGGGADAVSASPACMPELGRVYWFDWAPDSRRLVLGLSPPEPLTVFDTVSGQVTPLVRSDDDQVLRALEEVGFGQATRVQFESPRWSSSGGYIATLAMVFETVGGTGGNMVLVFDAGGNLVAEGKPGGGEFWGARAWSPTSDVFAYGSGGGQNGIVEVRTLDPDTGEDVAVFSTEATGRGTLRDLAWSPSGRWMAVVAETYLDTYAWMISIVESVTRETVATIDYPNVSLADWGP